MKNIIQFWLRPFKMILAVIKYKEPYKIQTTYLGKIRFIIKGELDEKQG